MKQRLLTASILCIILIPLVIIGGLSFEIGVTVLSILALREILDLNDKTKELPFFIKILSFLSVALITLCSEALIPCIALVILFIYIPLIFINNDEYNFDIASFLFGSTIFIGICFYLISNIRITSIDEFIYILLIGILTDTFAYIGGKLFGKHKLMPKVSPNKTIEGSLIGTIIGTIIPSLYYIFMVDPGISIFICIIMTIIISLTGQLGDLLFSAVKRHYKVKDYSNIFPGHGGILDRFDSLLIIGLIYTIIKSLFL